MFITIEGVDGLGKSTQIKKLVDLLGKENVYLTKEPGDTNHGSNIGSGIRSLLFSSPGAKTMAPGVADLLFLADHMQNSFEIEKKLKEGFIVISDRYADSQFAYAAGKSKNCPPWSLDLYRENYGVVPDIIVFLKGHNIGTGWALERARSRRGFEAGKQEAKPWNDIEEQVNIQDEYMNHFRDNTNVVTINISENDPEDQVFSEIVTQIAIENSKVIWGLNGQSSKSNGGL